MMLKVNVDNLSSNNTATVNTRFWLVGTGIINLKLNN